MQVSWLKIKMNLALFATGSCFWSSIMNSFVFPFWTLIVTLYDLIVILITNTKK